MNRIEWVDSLYSIGVDRIDEQHKRLLDMINGLHDSIQSGMSNRELGAFLTSLVDYIRTHFADEEKLMIDIHYVRFKQHKALHSEMNRKVAYILMKLRNDEVVSPREILSFLISWWTEHIAGEDKLIGPAVASAEKVEQTVG